jgi:hypothetical protein
LKDESDSDEEQKRSEPAAVANPLRSPLDMNSQNPLGSNYQQI